MGFKTGLWGLDVKYRFRDSISRTWFWGPAFRDWILESGNWDLFSLHISTFTFCFHLTLPFFCRDRVFGDRILGTRFRGPDFGDRILESGSQVKPILLESGALFSLHISTYLYFYFLSSLDITFLFSGLGFRDRVSGTGFWNQRIEICSVYISGLLLSVFTWHYLSFSGTGFLGTGFWGPGFRGQISGTGFRGPDFGDRFLESGS